MRRECGYVALAAAAAMLCGTAVAQNEQTQQREQRDDRAGAWGDSLAYDEYLAGRDLRASDLIDAPVLNQQGEALGRVEDLIVSADDVTQAVIAVGGVLGVGEKRVVVPYDELRVSRDGETLFLARTREQLEALPEYRAEEREAGLGEGAAEQPEAAAAQLAAQQQEGATQGGEPSAAEQAAQQAGQQAQAEEQAQQAEQQAQQAEQRAQQEQQAAEQERQAAEQQREEQERRAAAEDAQRPQPSERVTVMDRSDRRASELIGMTVVDSRGEEIGEIDDLVVSPEDGRIFAVLAVGGVIGIGERLVSVPLEDLELAPPDVEPREPGVAGEPDENAARLNMTSEQLIETQPEFQYSTDERTANIG